MVYHLLVCCAITHGTPSTPLATNDSIIMPLFSHQKNLYAFYRSGTFQSIQMGFYFLSICAAHIAHMFMWASSFFFLLLFPCFPLFPFLLPFPFSPEVDIGLLDSLITSVFSSLPSPLIFFLSFLPFFSL